MKYLHNINLEKNELQNARLQNLATPPNNPVVGQFYFNTSDLKAYICTAVTPSVTWIDMTSVTDPNKISNSIINAKGDLIVGTADDTPARLSVGSNGQVLMADSAQAAGVKWASLSGSSVGLGNVTNDAQIPKSIVDAKGDLIVATDDNTVSRLAVGTNNYALIADSAQTTGVKWAAIDKSFVGLGSVTNDAQIAKSILTAKGNIIVASDASTPVALAVGSNNQALIADSTQASGVKWATIDKTFVGLGSVANAAQVQLATITAKGDLIVGTANATVARQGVGSNGQVLVVDSAQTNGVKWATLDLTYMPDSSFKKPVKAASTANLTVTATTTTLTNSGTKAALILDGVTLAVNDRVLIKNQTTQSQNGIYVVTIVGDAATNWVLTRASSADSAIEIAGGVVSVDQGTTNGGLLFTNNFKATDTLGTTNMPWYTIYSSFDAATAATANKLVLRDSSGNITAAKGTFTTFKLGTVATAGHVLKTNATGDGTWGALTSSDVGLGNVTDDAQIPKSLIDAKGDLIVGTADNTPARLAVGTNGQILMADSGQAGGVKWATPSFAPATHASTHASNGADPISPNSIGAEAVVNKGKANGYAGLDVNAQVPMVNLPAPWIQGNIHVHHLTNRVTLASDSATVNIGIPSYNPVTDTLSVYVNSTFALLDSDFTATATQIVKSSGIWLAGTVFDFVVLTNVGALDGNYSGYLISDGSMPISKIAPIDALSVVANGTNASATPTAITAGADGHVLRRSGTAIGFGTVATAGIADNAITAAKFRQSAALSVVGNATNATANVTDIAAGTDGHVLRRSGTAIGFGTVATAGITDAAITYAKIQNLSALSVFGRSANSAGVGAAIAGTAASQVLKVIDTAGVLSIGFAALGKSEVGLSSVENYGIATKAEAEAGASNVKYMTPLRVAEAITALAPGISGTTSDTFQLDNDNGGMKLKTSGSEIQIRNAADNAYASLRVLNLYVEGSTTAINSNEVDIGDSEILLNSDVTLSTHNSDGGIALKRLKADNTTRADAKVNFNNSTGRWDGTFGAVASTVTKQFVNKHVQTIGNGSATSIDVTHSLGTQDVWVSVREVATNELVLTDIICADANKVTVKFTTAPTANSYVVTVIG